MRLTLDLWLTGEIRQSKQTQKITIDYYHDLTIEDLNEFAIEQGFKNCRDYFSFYLNGDTEELQEIETHIRNNDLFLLGPTIKVHCRDEKSLHDFLCNKYQNDILTKLLASVCYE